MNNTESENASTRRESLWMHSNCACDRAELFHSMFSIVSGVKGTELVKVGPSHYMIVGDATAKKAFETFKVDFNKAATVMPKM